MKRISIILSLFVVLSMHYSCKKTTTIDAGFKDMEKFTIYDYLVENESDYSSFLKILKTAGIDKTLSAYNPNGTTGSSYTLFVPNNSAVDTYIKESGQYATLDDLLKDVAFVKSLARYHVISEGVSSDNFPFGTFTQPTLSNDYLNVNFIIEKDTTYYKINNQAQVTKANIEVSNGFIQEIGAVLSPITFNSYGWLKKNPDYSIFTAAIEATGMDKILNVDMKLKDQPLKPFTMLVESDAIYKMRNINSFAQLANSISPDRTDYTSTNNPLYIFVNYHLLFGSMFLDDLARNATNYSTFADIPININGLGLDIVINKYKEIFVSSTNDTTDFIGIYYDESNVNTQSGAIHFINQILKPQIPSRAIVTFQFHEEADLRKYIQVDEGVTYLIENHALLNNVTWSGATLSYVKSIATTEQAWNKDYLQIDGDFTITYKVPKIVQGKYDVYLRADGFNGQNALVEVSVDGIKLGGLVDLTKGGNANNPYANIKVGTIDFKKYDSHAIQIKSLIPGILKWDYIRFEPI